MVRALAVLALGAMLVACGSTSQVRQPVEPLVAANALFVVQKPMSAVAKDGDQPAEHFMNAVASYLKSELAKSGRLAKDGDDALKVDIKVTEFRMRSGFTRQMFGIFAGKDGISSEVSVVDAQGKVRGQSSVSTYNVLAVGSEEDVARMHAEEIAGALQGRMKSSR
jgi:hypothetical protein